MTTWHLFFPRLIHHAFYSEGAYRKSRPGLSAARGGGGAPDQTLARPPSSHTVRHGAQSLLSVSTDASLSCLDIAASLHSFFCFVFLAPARLLLLFFWDYIFFWWFFNSNSMHRKWVNCTRNMVSFVFISLREITAPLLLLLLRYFRVTLFIVFWLSSPFSLSSRNL